jgi:hypothetical protein
MSIKMMINSTFSFPPRPIAALFFSEHGSAFVSFQALIIKPIISGINSALNDLISRI